MPPQPVQRQEVHCEQILTSIDAIVWEADPQTLRFTFVSDHAERLLGYSAHDWLAPEFWLAHVHPEDRDHTAQRLREAARDQCTSELRFRMVGADGRVIALRATARVVPAPEGALLLRGVLVVASPRAQPREDRDGRLWFLEGLDRVNRAIQCATSHERMMADVLETVRAIYCAQHAVLLKPCGPTADAWSVVTDRDGAHATGTLALARPLTPALAEVVCLVREAGRPVSLGAGSAHPLPTSSEPLGAQSALATAIEIDQGESYVLALLERDARRWSPEETQLLEEIVRRLVDGSRLFSTLRRLRESEAKFNEAQRLAHVGQWDNDLDSDRITWSDETYRILGLRPREVPPTLEEFRARIHPEDRDLQVAASARAERGAGSYDVEYRIVRPDGEVRTLHSVGEVAIDASGRPRRGFGVVQDITERKRAERALTESHALLHAIVEGTADAVFVKDLEGRYLLINSAGARFLGLNAADVIGRDDLALLAADAAATVVAHDRHVIASGESETFEEQLTVGGVARTFVSTRSIYRDGSGAAAGLIGIASDVTDIKRLEAQLRQSQKLEAVGQLAGGVAHDFNNLLTIITGHGAMLRSQLPADDESSADLDQVLAAADRASVLTRQLLAFSRRQLLQPRVTDLSQSVTLVADMLGRVIGEDITIRTELAPHAWPVLADPGQLEQVVMNLAVNARDAMPRGGTLIMRTENVEVDRVAAGERPGLTPGRYAALFVDDTGTGIEPDLLPHLFEPFFTTKGPGKGTGLGLATVYGIVKQSGGFIYVDSTPGQGSRFSIYLPRHAERAADETRPAAPPAPRGTETILVVEDDAGVRWAVRRMLERNGYSVLEAAGAAEALRHVADVGSRGAHIDLVLTDVIMPEQSGRELVERLTADRPELRILYMSGYADDEILRRGLELSGAPLLEKPFTPDRLAEVVRRALDQPRPTSGG
jgi:two-component system cell cycle sensor histidine kinase/response regulator CckA